MSKTLVVSHSPIFFHGLKNIFKGDTFILGTEFDLSHKLIESIKKIKPNIIILHQSYFEFLSEELIKYLSNHKDKIKLLVLGAKNKNNIDYYVKQGAHAYLYEDTDVDSLLKAYKDIKNDKVYFSEEISQNLLKNISNKDKQLTNKEVELMKFISDGFSSKEIARKSNCSVNTVNVHKFNMKMKLNIKSNAELFRYCASLANQ
jgi:two-component system nitrate/nitrite response regulator NarL